MPIVYAIFLLLAACFSLRYDRIETFNRQKSRCFRFLCGYLICIAGFSYGLGGDILMYMEDFENIPADMSYWEFVKSSLSFKTYMPGWLLYTMWVKRTFGSFYALHLIHALIVNISFCHFVSKYTKRVFLFLLLYFVWSYFWFNTLGALREAFAVVSCMFGMDCFLRGKTKLFVLFVLVGLMFHLGALVVFLFPVVNFNINLNWKLLFITLGAAFLLCIVSDIVIGKLFLEALGNTDVFSSKFREYAIETHADFGGFAKYSCKYLIIPFIVVYFSCKSEVNGQIKERKKKISSFVLLLGICISGFPGFTRFLGYTIIFYLIMLADFVYTLLRVKEYLIIRAVTFCCACYMLISSHFTYIEAAEKYFFQYFIPYTSILNEDSDVILYRKLMHDEITPFIATDENIRDVEDFE